MISWALAGQRRPRSRGPGGATLPASSLTGTTAETATAMPCKPLLPALERGPYTRPGSLQHRGGTDIVPRHDRLGSPAKFQGKSRRDRAGAAAPAAPLAGAGWRGGPCRCWRFWGCCCGCRGFSACRRWTGTKAALPNPPARWWKAANWSISASAMCPATRSRSGSIGCRPRPPRSPGMGAAIDHIWTYRLPSLLGAIAAAWLTVWVRRRPCRRPKPRCLPGC